LAGFATGTGGAAVFCGSTAGLVASEAPASTESDVACVVAVLLCPTIPRHVTHPIPSTMGRQRM